MKQLLGLIALLAPLTACGGEPFELRDKDRVVFLGNTFIEREQRYGYWETALTLRYPDRDILFRNLGWSGDTVFGIARAGFGTTADGFRHLKDHVLALKPTVLMIGYGTNESFEGEAGLEKFVQGLNVLLDTLAPTKARVVLFSPLKHENLGPSLPDPTEANKNLELYSQAIRKVAAKRGCHFVDFYTLLSDSKTPLTDNGMHLTAFGYWRAAQALKEGLGWTKAETTIEIASFGDVKGTNTKVLPAVQALDTTLPFPGFTGRLREEGAQRVVLFKYLAEGKYTLHADGKPVKTATAKEWTKGVTIAEGPEYEQAEQLRQVILAKNLLYFHRWRPQNETYLFGFRKHEQGQNAREIPEFDPLIEEKEKEIAKLRKPTPHSYTLIPQQEGQR